MLVAVRQIEDYSKLSDTIASHITLKTEEKQQLLESENLSSRFEKLLEFMNSELAMIEVENKIKSRVKQQMEKSQKEYYLNEQMKAIQKELNDGDEEDEISALKKRIQNAKLSKEAKDKAFAELRKLKSMGAMSSEATVVRNYLDWLLDIPWKKTSKVNNDLEKATKILINIFQIYVKVLLLRVRYCLKMKKTPLTWTRMTLIRLLQISTLRMQKFRQILL